MHTGVVYRIGLHPTGYSVLLNDYQIPFLTKKSRIQETKNLSTNADSRTDTIYERMRNLSEINK